MVVLLAQFHHKYLDVGLFPFFFLSVPLALIGREGFQVRGTGAEIVLAAYRAH